MLNIKSYKRDGELSLYLRAFFIVVAYTIIFWFDPEHSSFYPTCFFKKLTSLNCPGCGSSRALHQLAHGNILAALDYNILMVIFLPVIAIGLVNFYTGSLVSALKRVNKPRLILLIIAVFWLARNLPYYPFNILNADQ